MHVLLLCFSGMSWWFDACNTTEPPPPVPPVDTTSHDFTWTLSTLGDGGSSVLYDVTIINDTLVYAVGAIYKQDSLGNWDPLPYNVAKWNGRQWELKRVTVIFRGNLITPPINGIYALSASDIWLAAGMAIHGDGTTWVGHDVRAITGYDTLSFTKCWGRNSSDMYFVGLRGSLAHYFSGTWQKLTSGTTVPIQDIWGGVNQRTGATEIHAVASNTIAYPSGKKLLRIDGSQVTAMSDSGLNVFLNSIWFVPGSLYYIVGGGFFYSQSVGQATIWQGGPNLVTNYYSNAIRGSALNNVFIVGAYGDVVHFNGHTWKSFQQQTAVDGNYKAVAVRGNLVIAVGYDGDRAAVAVGRRN
ncbi:MAG: hypothetical protein AB1428_15010 [Bacteroidota bacterium]